MNFLWWVKTLNYDRRHINALRPKGASVKKSFVGFLLFVFFVLVVIALFK